MMNGSNLSEITALPVRARVAFALAVAEIVVEELADDPQGLALARSVLQLSWQWLSGKQVKADDIAEYVDSPTEKDLGIRELNYTKASMIAALIATTLAVGYAARKAYESEGAKSMPSPIWQVTDDSLKDVLDNAKKTSRYNDAAIERVSRFLIEKYAGQPRETMGNPVSAAEVLP